MNQFAVLSEGFEHLSYPLGRLDAAGKREFSEQKENYSLHPVDSEVSARMALEASDFMAEHASRPVGFVADSNGSIFMVCRNDGARPLPKHEMEEGERFEFSLLVMKRLGKLHNSGLGCGGLSPDAVVLHGKQAKLQNPAAIFMLSDSDSIFYEAVATLRALAGAGFARQSELERLASAYLSVSPVCRHGVAEHLSKKKINGMPHKELSSAARKYIPYF